MSWVQIPPSAHLIVILSQRNCLNPYCKNYFIIPPSDKYISRWKQGLENGNRGINTKTLSRHIKHYLLEKFGNKCSGCGWNQRNPVTGVVPLEIDHIDGNSENNDEKNLRLICPNCHSLTPHFRNLNRGKGRNWRIKYLKSSQANHST